VDDAGGVDGDGAGDGVVFALGAEVGRRQNEHLVRVDHAGLVGFGAADDDAVGALFDDADEQVGVGLLAGFLAAVALDVGHRAGDHQVVVLNVLHVRDEPLVIVGAALFVDFVGDDEGGVKGSKPTQRWKQVPVCWPIIRNILTLSTRSLALWWRWVKRLIFLR
jgi:hypothetical protein